MKAKGNIRVSGVVNYQPLKELVFVDRAGSLLE